MQLLQQQIQTGWPEHRSPVPPDIRAYCQDRQELTTQDGLIYKAHNILIPPKLRRDTLTKLHQSHQGMAKTKRLARESIYWPGMNAEIDNVVSSCEICQTNSNANTREKLQSHPIPSRPWQQIGTDLFEWKGKPHLIIVDYYSRYPEVAELRDTKARTVIAKTKSIFSRHGIPDNVISDNGPQYSSDEYRQFSQDYDFQHTTISPRYPQSGGLHEKTVQTVKRILEKCAATQKDPYLALLDYRNTPIDGVSPAQALMSRRLRSTLPVATTKLDPSLINSSTFRSSRENEQERQQKYFNRNAKNLPSLAIGETVRFKKDPDSKWTLATVVEKLSTPRSYLLQAENGSRYRRNRIHIRKINERPVQTDNPDQVENLMPTTITETQPKVPSTSTPTNPSTTQATKKTSRYGRVINPNPIYKT